MSMDRCILFFGLFHLDYRLALRIPPFPKFAC